ncbi:adenosylhomocysteinase [Halobacteriales archaeon QS_8_69_26]|nr:MAG: adenosylhomocysteinase [Halobacteriales archaeon QS_8_69_26]
MGSTDADPTDANDPLAWARDHAPVLGEFVAADRERRPFDGYTVAVASHLEASTGVFIETLHEAGAAVLFAPSEPESTHGEVVRELDRREGVEAFAREGMTDEEFADAQHSLLEREPDLICDDGCELIAKVHADHPEVARVVVGGCEQTTAGIHRLEAMDDDGVLAFPVYGVNDTPMKRLFDDVHGTGESSLANVMITTNATIAGKTVVVAGYGHCGRGIARKARALGAHTVVTEVDPRKALQAHVDGHRVATMAEAAPEGDLFVTGTGNRDVIREEHVREMADGATLANSGHFDVEIALPDLERMAERTSTPTAGVTRYHLPDGRRIDLLAEGRLVNLTGPYSQGHPIEVMDTTFGAIYAAARDLLDADLAAGLYSVPDRLDRLVAERKLDALGLSVDELTAAQAEYYDDWEHADSSF